MGINGKEFGGIIDPKETQETLAATNKLLANGFTVVEASCLLAVSNRINGEIAVDNAQTLRRLRAYRGAVRRGIFNEGF